MASTRSPLRLAHGWTLVRGPSLSAALVREFIRPAVRAAPTSLARRLGPCRVSLPPEEASGVASTWTMANGGLEVSISAVNLHYPGAGGPVAGNSHRQPVLKLCGHIKGRPKQIVAGRNHAFCDRGGR